MNKPINIFSFLHNCKQCFNLNKTLDLDKTVNMLHYGRQPEFVVNLCDRIVARIKNSHFSFYDFKLYIFTLYLFKEKVNWKDINISDVDEVAKKCTNMQYQKDKEFIDSLLKKLDLDKTSLLTVNSNGNNILLDLILDGKISPIYYVLQCTDLELFVNTKYAISERLKLINNRTETIKKILRR